MNFLKVTLFLFILNSFIFSCTSNSVLGTINNSIFYGNKMNSPTPIEFYLSPDYTGQYGNIQQIAFTKLDEELERRNFIIIKENLDSINSPTYYLLEISSIQYYEEPTSDSYTHNDGSVEYVETRNYDASIKGIITEKNTLQAFEISVSTVDHTRAGKSIFGTVTEKGIITEEGMIRRAVERFVGKIVNKIQSK